MGTEATPGAAVLVSGPEAGAAADTLTHAGYAVQWAGDPPSAKLLPTCVAVLMTHAEPTGAEVSFEARARKAGIPVYRSTGQLIREIPRGTPDVRTTRLPERDAPPA